MALIDQARDFLKACGYTVEDKDRSFLLAEKAGLGGEEQTCLWILTQELRRGRHPLLLEDEYLTRFGGAVQKYRGGRLHLLVDTTEGLSTEFRTKALRQYGVRVLVPAQFFDLPFKQDAGRGAASAIGELVKQAEKYEMGRVPQAFSREDSPGEGKDLVDALLREVEDARLGVEPRVWFVIAPAGQGKSVLFSALFRQLYRRFQDSKRRQIIYPRPLPMLPEHIRQAAGKNVMGLIDAFLRTDVATPTVRTHFDWMIDSGYGLLMLDGLDEVITRDETFFSYLEDRITAPGAHPAIIIAVRDSLFHSSDDLAEFLSYYSSIIRVYQLKPWDREAIRTYAWLQFAGKLPRSEEKEPESVRTFLGAVERDAAVQSLATLPFYATLLAERYRDTGKLAFSNELDLLNEAVVAMCGREYAKGTLREDLLPSRALQEWLEELAVSSYESGGVPVDELKELAQLLPALVTKEMTEEEEQLMVDQITMAPFLTRSVASGRVEFTHEVIGEYLTGRRFAYELKMGSPRFASRLSQRPWPPDSLLFKAIARTVDKESDRVVKVALGEWLPPVGFRNLIQLLVMTTGGDEALRNRKLQVEGTRLIGVRFERLDLSGVSFRGCDLTNVAFVGCMLQRANFERTLLQNTQFAELATGALDGATFGEGENFESVIVGKRRMTDIEVFRKWVAEQTGTSVPTGGPCATMLQMLHLFQKFVHLDGQGRRDSLPRRAVTRGRQVSGAPEYERCAQAAVEFGYLETAAFDHLCRPSGPRYGEIVSLVTRHMLSEGMRSLLDSLCRRPGCRHATR
jgi:hypothetical protein